MKNHIPTFENFLNEKRIPFKGKTVNDLYRIVKDETDASVFVNGQYYSVLPPDEMRNDLKNTMTYIYDKEGEEKEISISQIEFIEL